MDDDRLRTLLAMIGADGESRLVEAPMDEISSLLSVGLAEKRVRPPGCPIECSRRSPSLGVTPIGISCGSPMKASIS